MADWLPARRMTCLIGRINILDWTGRQDSAYSSSEFVQPSTLKAFLLSQSDKVSSRRAVIA